MKYRWLVALAFILVTACNAPKEEAKKPEATKPADLNAAETKAEATKTAEEKSANANAAETEASTATPAELLAEYTVAFDEFIGKMRNAAPEDRAAVLKTNPGPEFAVKFRAMAAENKGSEMAATALGWLAENSDLPEEKESSLATLLEKHADSPSMKEAAGAIAGGKPSKSAEDNLRRIMKDSPHREARGAATYQLVTYFDRYKSLSDSVDDLAKNPNAVKFFGEDGLEYLRNLKVDDAEIEQLYESIVTDYSDVVLSRMGRETNIGDAAKNALFEIQNLSMGCVAPNIEGNDLDGESFSLSDYRGKVVMLDFWGDW